MVVVSQRRARGSVWGMFMSVHVCGALRSTAHAAPAKGGDRPPFCRPSSSLASRGDGREREHAREDGDLALVVDLQAREQLVTS